MKKLFLIFGLALTVAACESMPDKIVFTQSVSASGARYEAYVNDQKLELLNKGREWRIYAEDIKKI
ncbi:MAG: MliC family protein [Rickettsiales bacterium]|jgi:membrane-bound inhibitor of C-type lysozyme|nr:MliC family protein [Rickettsiales bacterium]